jgi:hypothetical protein
MMASDITAGEKRQNCSRQKQPKEMPQALTGLRHTIQHLLGYALQPNIF